MASYGLVFPDSKRQSTAPSLVTAKLLYADGPGHNSLLRDQDEPPSSDSFSSSFCRGPDLTERGQDGLLKSNRSRPTTSEPLSRINDAWQAGSGKPESSFIAVGFRTIELLEGNLFSAQVRKA
jgi:hypothetical protein